MEVNFKCKDCKTHYDYEVGKVSIDEKKYSLVFEKEPVCPKCGATDGKGLLSELGQTQMTEWWLNKR